MISKNAILKTKKTILKKKQTIFKKTKNNFYKQQNHNKNFSTYIISECYNDNLNKLKTDKLRYYLKHLNLFEDSSIKNNDLKTLKKMHKQLTNNFKNQVLLYKSNPINYNDLISKHPQFIWFSSIEKTLDKRMYKLNCFLTNIIAVEKLHCVTNKSLLYENISKSFPQIKYQHLADTFPINDLSKYNFNNNRHYILRPIDSFSGKDIFYVSSRPELIKALNFYKTTKNHKGVLYGSKAIASEYIINPLLFKGYKFHLRMYLIISYIYKIYNSFFMEEGDILTADKSYTTEKPFLKSVHDTHQTSSNNDYFFPKDLKTDKPDIDCNDLISQMRNIMICVSKIIKKDPNDFLYENQANGFYITGVDFMVDHTGNVILIEVNEKPGFGYNKPINDINWSAKFFSFINYK